MVVVFHMLPQYMAESQLRVLHQNHREQNYFGSPAFGDAKVLIER